MASSRPPDTPAGQENTPLGNPDSRSPKTRGTSAAGEVRRGSRGADRRGRRGSRRADRTGRRENRRKNRAGRHRNREETVEGPHEEWSRPEQLSPRENLDKGQGSPETPRLCHVHGGAWFQQGDDLPYLLSFSGFPGDAIPPRDLQQDSRRSEREKRKEEITTVREKDSWTDKEDL
ncbi:hypothetical protein NDU88_008269 [Pleurodeles waltl]|uniref:Uncharacterized protein n=1 Tax=Pleurodeles waltl TaxID=8319 RepID=A0AAV7PNT8_PLEWA|nr:hypothetical protein NDU88_008269 [Pleurodeles waltl]